ncbi:RING finger domain protein [Penicillium herquei]|nr:RING finger domain protein [Penicillium herquei]
MVTTRSATAKSNHEIQELSKKMAATSATGRTLRKRKVSRSDDEVSVEIAAPKKKARSAARKTATRRTATARTVASERVEGPTSKTEKRKKVWQTEPSASFNDRMHRCALQQMFIMNGKLTEEENMPPQISFDVVGATGNLYKVVVGQVPTCTCPDLRFRRVPCKHICYALVHALKAPANLQYQLAFLSSEIREIWEGSPLCRIQSRVVENNEGNRKPIEGDCPICFMEFETDPEKKEEIIWCQASCGNNVHKGCFADWAKTTRHSGVRCVYCRAPWKCNETAEGDFDIEILRNSGHRGQDGYINVAAQFGLPERRDYSVYSRSATVRRSHSSGQQE